jgi:hypothetical protein
MIDLNLKAFTSAAAALALTVLASWTFVDATSVMHLPGDGGASFLAAVSALVG